MTLLSTLISFLMGGLPKFLDFFQDRSDKKHELDHPDSQVINLKNASHAVRDLWWVGDEIHGKVEIFCDMGDKGTTSGRIAGALVKNGLIIGISSRGMGSLKQMGEVMEVQDDFELLTWDLVSNPSNPDSWMKNGALNESRTTFLDPYSKTNSIITEILCAKGTCPLDQMSFCTCHIAFSQS